MAMIYIKSQGDENYKYDPIGNLIHDDKAGIDNIEWTVYGKIKGISKTNGVDITYTYDAAGNRISKDATVNNGDLTQTETELYGSSRLGMSTLATNVENRPVPVTTNMPGLGEGKNIIFTRGNKLFELSNHLGNVLATVSDEKKPISLNGTTIDHYEAKITSAQDYYPFGMLMPGRNGHHIAGGWFTGSSVVNGYTVPESLTLGSRAGNQPGEYTASQTINFTEGFNSGANDAFSATIADDSYEGGGSGGTGDGSNVVTSGYRFGFNGKENDSEVKGEGNQQDYGMRIYDPRIGRFLSVDPLTTKYPFYSPYLYAGNSPIRFIDRDGEGPGDGIKTFAILYTEMLRIGTKRMVNDFAHSNVGKATGKTTAQAYISTLGVINGTTKLLSFGAYSTPYERLNLPEEYRGWYYWGTVAGASQPLPEASIGSGASPGLSLSRGGGVVAPRR